MNGIYRRFFSYVIPSVLAFALSGVYAIVDGFFVGNSIGDIGLSAINVAYPVVTLMQATGSGIGMGGAVLYAVSKAKGEKEEADAYAGGTMVFLLAASVFISILCYIFVEPILIILGAEGQILPLGTEYLRVIIPGAVFQIFAVGIVPMIRNHEGASFAMGAMIAGFLTNIALDYLLVWELQWGMAGAALATIIGEAVTMAAGVVYLLTKKFRMNAFHIRKMKKVFLGILKIGVAPFGLTMSPILSLILMNRYSMEYGGESAVACYACIAYATTIVYMLLQGVGDGSQPLLSRYYGAGEEKELCLVRRLAYCTAAFFAVVSLLVLLALRCDVGRLFGSSEEVTAMVGNVMLIFIAGFPFLAFTRVTTSSFYATEKAAFSYILVYAEPVILFVLLMVWPRFTGLSGVWWSMCAAQILSMAAAAVLKWIEDRKEKPEQQR